jgi:hypothetical protein
LTQDEVYSSPLKLLRLNDKEARNETARDKIPDELEIEKPAADVS